ncbi:MAG: 50S ribosomal protein L25 [Spirochaetales bacterium]|nr:50S ribosomal protein L25 [Spirochaetales bacterium]
MNKLTLSAEARTTVKNRKGENYRLRREGKIPAIVYGAREPMMISVNELEFSQKFKVINENVIVTLEMGKTTCDVLVKDYQEDLLLNKIVHLDFYAIDPNRILRTRVPVRLIGSAKGAKEGGILEQLLHEIDVECLPQNMPEKIELDVSDLDIHHSIHVSDLAALADVKFLNAPDQVVCHVVTKAAEIEEAPKVEAVAGAPVEGEAPAAAPETAATEKKEG